MGSVFGSSSKQYREEILQRYPEVAGLTLPCKVCHKIRQLDTDFSFTQVGKFVHPKARCDQLMCKYCVEIQQKDQEKRRQQNEKIFKESEFIKDPVERAMYDMNRGLRVDLKKYGIKPDYSINDND